MFRYWIILTALMLCATRGLVTEGASPKLESNDVSWLWPVPRAASTLDATHIGLSNLVDTNGSAVWSDAQFADMLNAAASDKASVESFRINFPDSVKSKNVWRVAGVRFDPSAPGGHASIIEGFGSSPQIRLIAQPVTIEAGSVKVHDIAVHLVYQFESGRDERGRSIPDKNKFRQIVADLDAIKRLTESKGLVTSGKPLGIHPGPSANDADILAAMKNLLSTHLSSQRLSAMAIMGTDGPDPWIFLSLARTTTPQFQSIGFLPAQMVNFRTPGGIVSPVLNINNSNPSNTGLAGLLSPQSKHRGVTTASLFVDDTDGLDLDGFAVVENHFSGTPVLGDEVRVRDIPDAIANPIRSQFFNTDCVSCHTETHRRLTFNLSPGPLAHRVDGEPPKIDPNVLPKSAWNVRNFGWFPPSIFIGGGPTAATATQRTANETAEVVAFIEREYR